MIRSILIASFITITLAAGSSDAGALEALSQYGYARAQPTQYWAQRSDEEHYPAAQGARCIFQVRYYKQNWKYKKHAAFRTFAAARIFMLQQKMSGHFAHLSIHELHPRSQTNPNNYWLP